MAHREFKEFSNEGDIFRTNMRRVRKALRLTQADLAEYTGIHTSRISEYEKGVSTPRLDEMINICSVMGIRVKDTFDEKLELHVETIVKVK